MKKLHIDFLPTGKELLRILIDLYAEQEGVKITYEMEEIQNAR
jgi:hypothetical protein